MGRGSPPSLTGWGGRAGRRDPPAARPGQRVGVGPLPGHRSGPEHRDPRRGVGLSPLPSTPGNGGLRWVQFPGTPGPLREAGPHQPSAPQAPLPPGYRDLCRGPRLPPRSSPWVPVTAPHPGIRALWSGRSVSRGVTGDPRAPGTGGLDSRGFHPAGMGGGAQPGVSRLREGVRSAGPCGDPARRVQHRQRLRCGERTDVALDGACCPPRCFGRVDPATAGLPQNRLLMY